MSAQRTGGGYCKWLVVARTERRVVAQELTKRDAQETADEFNRHSQGDPRYRVVRRELWELLEGISR